MEYFANKFAQSYPLMGIWKDKHVLGVFGSTGSGKTTAMKAIVSERLDRGSTVELFIADGKGRELMGK